MKKRYEGRGSLITWAIAFAMTLCVAAPRQAQKKRLDAPFVPSMEEIAEAMLKLAKVTKDDVVYDLGCGDGRIVIMAAKKLSARGFDMGDWVPDKIEAVFGNSIYFWIIPQKSAAH